MSSRRIAALWATTSCSASRLAEASGLHSRIRTWEERRNRANVAVLAPELNSSENEACPDPTPDKVAFTPSKGGEGIWLIPGTQMAMDMGRSGFGQRHDARWAGLVNAALNKPACQSSLSQWSKEDDAGQAVSGLRPDEFAFHTAEEERPFWEVDLGQTLPIEAIVLHNRIGGRRDRARTVRVEMASERGAWHLVHAGYAHFGAEGDGLPLELWIGGDLDGRWIRVSLDERGTLHLSQVLVLVKPERLAFSTFCQAHGLERLRHGRTATRYEVVGTASGTMDAIVGLTINYSGRFGNLLHQYVNAIQFAQRTGLKYVRFGRHDLLDFDRRVSVNGLELIPAAEPLPTEGRFLAGEFFNANDFVPVLSPFLRFEKDDERAFTATVQEFIVPHILRGLPVEGEIHPEDELTIHLRSGDIFGSDHPVTFGYRQPPLAFYQLVVRRMVERGIRQVRLVFEDRGNPCVDALAAWLDGEGLPTRTQSVSLRADMSALVDAPHLVFGHGTFGYAAARLSKATKTLHYFAPELGGAYGHIPTIAEVWEVSDAAGGYIKAFEYGKPFGPDEGWRNTPQMREMMLSYPVEALRMQRSCRS